MLVSLIYWDLSINGYLFRRTVFHDRFNTHTHKYLFNTHTHTQISMMDKIFYIEIYVFQVKNIYFQSDR